MKKAVRVVAALIHKGNRFLICRRPGNKARGSLWEFAGGKVEPGESDETALVRECREELEITVTVGKLFCCVTHEYPDIKIDLAVYNAEISEGQPNPTEHTAIEWIKPSEAENYEFCPADVDILKKIKEEYEMKEVFNFLKKCGTYYLATSDNGQARVRPFGTVDIFEDKLCFQTGKVKNVSKQIHANPKIEICAFDGSTGTWLRLSGDAFELDSIEAQEHMLAAYPELGAMYKSGDGNTEIFYIKNATAVFSSFTADSKAVEF